MTMCSSCSVELINENRSKGYKTLCKPCYAEYMKKYYKNNPEKYAHHKTVYVKENDKAWALKAQSLILPYLMQGCVDCGEKNIVTLEFDHLDPEAKDFSISSLMRKKTTEEKFMEELKKCEVVCANCHRIRTAKIFGSWRLEIDLGV